MFNKKYSPDFYYNDNSLYIRFRRKPFENYYKFFNRRFEFLKKRGYKVISWDCYVVKNGIEFLVEDI